MALALTVEKTHLITVGATSLNGCCVTPNDVYGVYTYNAAEVWRTTLAGDLSATRIQLVSGATNLRGVCVPQFDPDHVYYLQRNSSTNSVIFKVPLAGGSVTTYKNLTVSYNSLVYWQKQHAFIISDGSGRQINYYDIATDTVQFLCRCGNVLRTTISLDEDERWLYFASIHAQTSTATLYGFNFATRRVEVIAGGQTGPETYGNAYTQFCVPDSTGIMSPCVLKKDANSIYCPNRNNADLRISYFSDPHNLSGGTVSLSTGIVYACQTNDNHFASFWNSQKIFAATRGRVSVIV